MRLSFPIVGLRSLTQVATRSAIALGVEMKAGGVCAAAKEFNMDVAVIRGVSDLADPRKSDSEWRRRAMKTVAIKQRIANP